MKIVSSAKMSEKHQISLRERFKGVDFYFYDDIEEAVDSLKDAEILITYGEDLTDEIIESMPLLKWIQVISAGLEKMPFQSLKNRQIIVTNAKGIHQIPMSEYTMAVILQLARRTNQLFENQKKATWDRSIRVSEIHGSTLGIIGLGAIGQSIAEKAKSFGMKVIGINSDGRPVSGIDQVYPTESLRTVLRESDYVVVIVPLTPQTHHLIGEKELKEMKKSAYLINIARGEVIDESSLVTSLEKEEIQGAVLDVFSLEPLPKNHPFWELENVIITPHLSGRSPKYMERALEIFKDNLPIYMNGELNKLINLVNVTKGY